MTDNLYRKKSVIVEAIQWFKEGDHPEVKSCLIYGDTIIEGNREINCIDAQEGTSLVEPGDWIIKGVNGDFYPIKNDIFEKTYEKVIPYVSTYETHQADKEHAYIYVICGRKSWHYADGDFKGWEAIDCDRGDYTEVHTLRKKILDLTEEDKQTIKEHGEYEVGR